MRLHAIRWKWGVLAAVAMAVLSLIPQFHLWFVRGQNWQGSCAYIDLDEIAYSAYVNALIQGRPRRNDPFTGLVDQPEAPQAESFLSIQFLPPYTLALPSRLLRLSASAAFILLMPVAAAASALAIFWLLATVTNDDRLAAAGALVVLCFGTLICERLPTVDQGAPKSFFTLLPLMFLRRYQIAASFPWFFVFCALLWRALTNKEQQRAVRSALASGVVFAVLVFSYFYLWTTAAAWLACLALVWFVARSAVSRNSVLIFSVVAALALAALVPYFILLSQRAEGTDSAQLLVASRAPDLFRGPELVGAIILAALAVAARRSFIEWRNPTVLFAASFALTPMAVFNQQIVTNRSLQPFHYEVYIANYVVVAALMITVALLWRGQTGGKRYLSNRVLKWIAIAALEFGALTMVANTRTMSATNIALDEAMPVAARLTELGRGTSNSVVLSTSLLRADIIPTTTPHPVLWAPHMPTVSVIPPEEIKERLHAYLYYIGTDENAFSKILSSGDAYIRGGIFGWDRMIPALTVNPKPITPEEIHREVQLYATYVASFTHAQAARTSLSYVIDDAPKRSTDFSNLDRWYEREAGERIGNLTLYRVKRRP